MVLHQRQFIEQISQCQMPDALCPHLCLSLEPPRAIGGQDSKPRTDRLRLAIHSTVWNWPFFFPLREKGCVYCLPDKRSCAKGGNHPMLHCRRVTPHLSGKMRLLILLYYVVLLSFCVYERTTYYVHMYVPPQPPAPRLVGRYMRPSNQLGGSKL